jgi:Protein of unknown function (DUF2281)
MLVEVMSRQFKPLDELVRELPPDSQAEVRDFIESLLEKRTGKPARNLSQGWAGALSDYREEYTSLELQKKALDWRGD